MDQKYQWMVRVETRTMLQSYLLWSLEIWYCCLYCYSFVSLRSQWSWSHELSCDMSSMALPSWRIGVLPRFSDPLYTVNDSKLAWHRADLGTSRVNSNLLRRPQHCLPHNLPSFNHWSKPSHHGYSKLLNAYTKKSLPLADISLLQPSQKTTFSNSALSL